MRSLNMPGEEQFKKKNDKKENMRLERYSGIANSPRLQSTAQKKRHNPRTSAVHAVDSFTSAMQSTSYIT
jgi:hypothetical protein